MSKKLFTIAFDLGGVIFEVHNDNRLFKRNYLETTLSDGMYDLIVSLSQEPRVKLIIISKAYPTNARKSKEILNMYGLTDCFNSIIFCEKNSAKYPIARAMGVDLMIDDKEEVLEPFDSPTFLYNASTKHLLRARISRLLRTDGKS